MTTTAVALDRVLLLNALLTEDMGRFERAHGLTSARVHLLWQLGASGPSTQAALATALSVSPRNVTGLVDGLAGSGHVVRAAHPDDRRASLVTLTDSGAGFVAELQEGHAELAGQLFADLPAGDLAGFVAVLDRTIARVGALMAEQPS